MPENQITLPVRAQDAIMLFRRFGVDVTGMSREAIKAARRDLLHRHHPDRGGDLDSAQLINAAYDLLKDGVPDEMFYSTDLDLYEAHKAKNPGSPEWVWAGYFGGIPDATIYRNDFSDVNFIKKSMWELSGQSRAEYTIWGFDGQRFHGISVFGSPKNLQLHDHGDNDLVIQARISVRRRTRSNWEYERTLRDLCGRQVSHGPTHPD
jgi:curved DNA-binding protein CbpA